MTDVYLDDYDPGAGVAGRWSLALAAALAKSTGQPPTYGFTVRLREQDYHLDQPLVLDRSTRLVAAGWSASTRLVCDGDGIIITGGGELSSVVGVTLVGPGKATSSTGVHLKARASLRGVRLSGFGTGYLVDGDGPKANLWRMTETEAVSCGVGFLAVGADSNGGRADSCSARDCDVGVWDRSFLGNAWLAPSVEGCGVGFALGVTKDASGAWVPLAGNAIFGALLAPYCEGNSPSLVAYPWQIVGGIAPHPAQASMPSPTWLSQRGYEGQCVVWAPDGGRVRVGGYPGFVMMHEPAAGEALVVKRASDGTYTLGVGNTATSPAASVGHGVGGAPRVFRLGEGGVPMTSWSSAPTWPMPDGSPWPVGSVCWSTAATPRGWRFDGSAWVSF